MSFETEYVDGIAVDVADQADAVPPEFLDEIVSEYLNGVIFDGKELVAKG